MKADCVTLWIGDSLGPVERACLRSVMRHGHSVALYSYGEVAGVPGEVELRDASAILPEDRIMRHRSGSFALFSDWFRYELQRRSLGTWIDTDIYLVAPLDMSRPHLFGKQAVGKPRPFGLGQKESINGAILRLPPDSPMLAPLLEQFEARRTPDWVPKPIYLKARLVELLGGEVDPSSLPWGTAGPFALTAVARRLGLYREALPCDVFNPVPWYDCGWISDPGARLEAMVTGRTVGVHLWNDLIKGFKDAPAPEGSFLDRLHREGRE